MKTPLFKVPITENLAKSIAESLEHTLSSGYIGQGPKVAQFEKMISEYVNSPYVNAVNSATSGLHLALKAIKKNLEKDNSLDKTEILTTPLTCLATNTSILSSGFEPKWVDVTSDMTIDLEDLKRKISRKTAGLMLVHWGGMPNPLDKIDGILEDWAASECSFKPIVIEDCAHAFGSKLNGQMIGSHGNFAVFSFGAIKHLTTGDGGAVISPGEKCHELIKLSRWYGLSREPNCLPHYEQNLEDWSSKYTMNDIAATVGIENFSNLYVNIFSSRACARHYNVELRNIEGLEIINPINGSSPSYWLYTVKVERRSDFIKKMAECGVEASRVHGRNDKNNCLKKYACDLPMVEYMDERICCLPCGWWVSEDEQEFIVDQIKKGW